MIDRAALLARLKPLVVALEASILARLGETPEAAGHLELEHARAVGAGRTAMSLGDWREGEVTQAAVAWVLGCVFVRFLEDNRLIDQPLISGPGGRRAAALGHREEHFRAHPAHSDREYLEACFRDVAAHPAVAALYNERHNPLWLLGPTADGARQLRETFAAIEPDTGLLEHDFSDPELGTRFLGDLYQDLSEAARKRYALLQTPDFVERFILDRTLDPAIEEFGLEEVRLIDPTCGSGHFLIGAFERLFVRWLDREPATDRAVLAQRCLDQIAGVDLNPYATAIAQFRLVITAFRACGITLLSEAPAFATHLATGDSLLHGPVPSEGATMLFDANRLNQNIAHVYETEDAAGLKLILGRGYHVVVGNPPYIAGVDAALREAYRFRFESCQGLFTMVVPFMERFFELGRVPGEHGGSRAGFVGKITGNNFMKREFGAPLVEEFLTSVDVQTIVDASGAYIPGHGTPTILLFGRSRPPVASTLRVVDGIRGEPTQPTDPAFGLVWAAITDLVDRPGEENAFVRSSDITRGQLLTHPMLLGIGRDLKMTVEVDGRVVSEFAVAVGRIAASSADDVFTRPRTAWRGNLDHVVQTADGASVRDWAASTDDACLFPYSPDGLARLSIDEMRALWPHRTTLWSRRTFSKLSYREEGREWWEWHQVATDRLGPGLTIAWGEVSTHNHFVLDRGEKVFKQTAPVIKLPEGATEAEHLALLGVLNSSVACFWLRQVCQPKGGAGIGRGIHDEAWETRHAFNAENVKELPIPPRRSPTLATVLDRIAVDRASLLDGLATLADGVSITDHLHALRVRDAELATRMVSLQEELDWQALAAYGLAPEDLPVLGEHAPPIALGQRAFEIVLARQVAAGETETTWFARHGSTSIAQIPAYWPADYREVVGRRLALIESDPDVGLIERPEHKRRWNCPSWEERQRKALTGFVLDALEDGDLWSDLRPRSTADLADAVRPRAALVEALELLAQGRDSDIATTVRRLVIDAAVPHVAAQRLTDKGARKRAIWEHVWNLQRAEDRGDRVSMIRVPPKYAQADFRSATFWKHRGKLDVPKERFVLIPNAERGADTSPVVGWAGWDERDLARALAGRITELRDQDGADAHLLTPLLAGVLELLPWIHQWHLESDPLYGGPPGQYFEGWLDGRLAELAVTRETLRSWRPPAPARGRRAKATSA